MRSPVKGYCTNSPRRFSPGALVLDRVEPFPLRALEHDRPGGVSLRWLPLLGQEDPLPQKAVAGLWTSPGFVSAWFARLLQVSTPLYSLAFTRRGSQVRFLFRLPVTDQGGTGDSVAPFPCPFSLFPPLSPPFWPFSGPS